MQTFLPYPNFAESAKALDDKRLGKQRVETKQIYNVLKQGPRTLYRLPVNGEKKGEYIYEPIPALIPDGHTVRITPWYNHPAVQMWVGHESTLAVYGRMICSEWVMRGNQDTLFDWFNAIINKNLEQQHLGYQWPLPSWMGNEEFHKSHRSNLLRKNPIHYSQFGWNEPSDLPYIWPKP